PDPATLAVFRVAPRGGREDVLDTVGKTIRSPIGDYALSILGRARPWARMARSRGEARPMMSGQVGILHYLNQFFGGLGGEEHADAGLSVLEGAVGPGLELQRMVGERGRVLATLIAGDNYMHDHAAEAAEEIVRVVRAYRPSV